jgi:hypothetical protein
MNQMGSCLISFMGETLWQPKCWSLGMLLLAYIFQPEQKVVEYVEPMREFPM